MGYDSDACGTTYCGAFSGFHVNLTVPFFDIAIAQTQTGNITTRAMANDFGGKTMTTIEAIGVHGTITSLMS